jgi:hypothetical protein
MNGRSRFALIGVLVLAICVAASLLAGPAEAKKKKKKSANSITVSKTTPTVVPPGDAVANHFGFASAPLTVGKKAKGKVVGWDSVTVTTSWSATAPDVLDNVFARVKAPNGRTVGLAAPPVDDTATAAGPTTETPNSNIGFCVPDPTTPPPPPCADPDDTLGPPYAGTIGNTALAFFGGIPAKGTWTVEVLNNNTTSPATLNSVSITLTLKTAPV